MEDFSSDVCVNNFTKEHETLAKNENEDFSCEKSIQTLSTQQVVVEYSETYKSKSKFSCKFCHETFTHRCKCWRHILSHTKPYMCKICTTHRRFAKVSHLVDHHKKVHSGEKLMCEKCNSSYTNMDLFQDHIRSHTRKKIFTCEKCLNDFASKEKLMRHTKKVHKNKTVSGTSSSATAYVVKKDFSIHKLFSCHFCKEGFTQKGLLKEHYKMLHSEEKKIVCDVCNKEFFLRKDLENHKKENHAKWEM